MNRDELASVCERIPGTVTVTIESWLPDGSFDTAIMVLYAEERPLDNSDRNDDGFTSDVESMLWKLSTKYCSIVPKHGDRITDPEGRKWLIVGSVGTELMRAIYRCRCERAAT